MAKKLKASQRMRVIHNVYDGFANSVSFYTTAGQIRKGVGDFITFNAACRSALEAIEAEGNIGIAGTFNGFAVQLNVIE